MTATRMCSRYRAALLWEGVRMVARVIRGPWLLIGLFVLLSLMTLVVWDTRGVYGLTGDEPHYLVIADSLIQDHTVEVTSAYTREFAERSFYVMGLAPPDSPISAPAAHVVQSPIGLVSWHGVGIPVLASLPLMVGGIWGVKIAMLLSGVIAIAAAWRLANWAGLVGAARSFTVAAVALAYPVLLASTQVYPDLWAGALLLSAVTWLAVPLVRTRAGTILVSVGVGLLPWLGMKFAPAAMIILVAMLLVVRRRRHDWIPALGPAVILGSVLVVFNMSVFGSITGAPTEGALEFGRNFLMLVPGLILDQNQGPVFYSPVLWLGLLGVGLLWRRNRRLALVWAATFTAVWLPGAAHPGLYGLGSFNGRYSWVLAMLLILPATLALGWLHRAWRLGFWSVIGAGVAFQIYVFVLSVFVAGSGPGRPSGLDLYAQPEGTWLESYSALWFPFQQGLPAWYDSTWAFAYGPNFVWLGIALLAVICGFRLPSTLHLRGRVAVVVSFILLIGAAGVAGQLAGPGSRDLRVIALSDSRVGVDDVGFPVTGPLHAMRQGTYDWFVDYAASGSGIVGTWELVHGGDGVVVASGQLTGTGGLPATAGGAIRFFDVIPQRFFLRIGWYGAADMTTSAIGVRRAR